MVVRDRAPRALGGVCERSVVAAGPGTEAGRASLPVGGSRRRSGAVLEALSRHERASRPQT